VNRANTRFSLALIAILIGGGILAALIAFPIPEGNAEPLLLALGLVLGWGGTVFGFYFGTSESSAQKSELMADRPTGHAGDPVHTEEEGNPDV
tara:strand:- start:540 stop:818 length:279 start_codon:yes stop_codon:yes gene_type:complete